MSRYNIALTRADMDTIADDGTVSVTFEPGLTFEVTSEGGWNCPSPSAGIYRFALSRDQVARLGWGRTTTVLPSGLDGSVQLALDTAEVSR